MERQRPACGGPLPLSTIWECSALTSAVGRRGFGGAGALRMNDTSNGQNEEPILETACPARVLVLTSTPPAGRGVVGGRGVL